MRRKKKNKKRVQWMWIHHMMGFPRGRVASPPQCYIRLSDCHHWTTLTHGMGAMLTWHGDAAPGCQTLSL
jgi:hypothetical protein